MFSAREAEVLAVGPDGEHTFAAYWRAERLPFIGIPDPDHRIAVRYRQAVNLFKLGRMPLVTVVDPTGLMRFAHYAASMSDLPESKTLLGVLDRMARSTP